MVHLRPLVMSSALPILLSCSTTSPKAAGAQRGVCEGEPAEVVVAANGVADGDELGSVVGDAEDAEDHAETGGDGWLAEKSGGGIRRVARAKAMARIRSAPTRVLLEPTFALDECRNGLSTHAYFQVPASAGPGPKPFQAAVIVGEVLPWRTFERRTGELYIAGVRVGTLHAPRVPSCHGAMPPRDAAVIALVPVRDAAEGQHLLEEMR